MRASLTPWLREVLAAPEAPHEDALTEALYQRWFIDWRAPIDLTHQASGDDRFVAALGREVGEATFWAEGWTVTGRAGTRAFVSDTHVQLYVDALSELSPRNPAVGATVKLRMPCARGCATPGFFLLVSRKGRAPDVHDKLYLHLTKAGGRAVLKRLHALDARFEVKIANSPLAYGRRDSGVVYVDPADRQKVIRALRPLSANPALFHSRVPPMTQRVGRGLSWAQTGQVDRERPGSFGEERCRLVARALLRARDAGERSLEPALSDTFREAGVDPSAPWQRST